MDIKTDVRNDQIAYLILRINDQNFALSPEECKNIKKGEKMYQIGIPNAFDVPYKKFDKLKPYVREQLLQFFPFKVTEKDKEPINFWYPVNSMQAYINHNDEPNYDPFEDVALKDIKKGDEIFEDYRKIDGWGNIYKFLD